MPLRLWDEAAPDVQVLHGPLVRALQENVVRHDVVVAKRRHNWNHIIVGPSPVLVRHPEHLSELVYQVFILVNDLLLCAGVLLIVVVSRRVACPNDEINVIPDVVLDPLERLVHQRKRRITPRRLCAVDASRPSLAVACCVLGGARVRLVERVRVEICNLSSAAGSYSVSHQNHMNSPVTCRKRPVSFRPLGAALVSPPRDSSATAALGGAAEDAPPQTSRPHTSASRGRNIVSELRRWSCEHLGKRRFVY